MFYYNVKNKYGSGYMFKVDKNLTNANIPRTIRFTESLFEQLNQVAVDNGISFNLLVLQCCKYAMDHYEDNSLSNK